MAIVDAKDFLNSKLAAKAQITKRGERHRKEKYCTYPTPPSPVVVFGVGPDRDAGQGVGRRSCDEVIVTEGYNYSASAAVTSTRIVKGEHPVFGAIEPTGIPENVRSQRVELINGSKSVRQTYQEQFAVAARESVTRTLTHTVQTSTAFGANATFGASDVGSKQISVSHTIQITNSEVVATLIERTVTRTTTQTFNIDPAASVSIEAFVYESPARIPFTMKVILDGDLEQNVSGVSVASDLLSEDERMFVIEGYVDLVAASNLFIRIKDIPPDGVPESDEAVLKVITVDGDLVSTESLRAYIADNFVAAHELPEVHMSPLIGDGPVIGPPDGIHYQVLYSYPRYEPTPACGFNDLSIPNQGEFNVEVREYSHYIGGSLVRQWRDEVSTFSRCHLP